MPFLPHSKGMTSHAFSVRSTYRGFEPASVKNIWVKSVVFGEAEIPSTIRELQRPAEMCTPVIVRKCHLLLRLFVFGALKSDFLLHLRRKENNHENTL